ncbi:hypothetical protein TTHERM_000630368 (macronuclear) [Tetrahymena thermophila SB210]|uniref:Uncharacterized protein n=1 Tax=Tetrahymena thermophila (strain SB210) TaxID=312017 RepID=W7XHI1_TETTS|nr:hypothetical protein TTHERM_000630368 [Tetrahymena thermophila SB210]EWS72564.1 hypothetical protein TTHERM_000630368 [Tetrahymena thermophila SB210]|eukprot:XP_012654847.1 hypothetical protein TTHERM_000630368 [Tetrahymena thermophila SB210]
MFQQRDINPLKIRTQNLEKIILTLHHQICQCYVFQFQEFLVFSFKICLGQVLLCLYYKLILPQLKWLPHHRYNFLPIQQKEHLDCQAFQTLHQEPLLLLCQQSFYFLTQCVILQDYLSKIILQLQLRIHWQICCYFNLLLILNAQDYLALIRLNQQLWHLHN